MNTTQNLPAILTARNRRRYARIIERAECGHYHDTISQSSDPKGDLEQDLSRFPELKDLLSDVKQGNFSERDASYHLCSAFLMFNNLRYCSNATS